MKRGYDFVRLVDAPDEMVGVATMQPLPPGGAAYVDDELARANMSHRVSRERRLRIGAKSRRVYAMPLCDAMRAAVDAETLAEAVRVRPRRSLAELGK